MERVLCTYCGREGHTAASCPWSSGHSLRMAAPGESSRLEPCVYCRYRFDRDLLGAHGCPNCEGTGSCDHDYQEVSYGSWLCQYCGKERSPTESIIAAEMED